MTNTSLKAVGSAVIRALARARLSILMVGLTYVISVSIGMFMVHTGNPFALSQRDRTVSQAQSGSTLIALHSNNRLKAALLDFSGNLLGAVSSTVSGLGVITSFPLIAYRGWIGGIVSVDSSHLSRFSDPQEAMYYVTTLILQLIPYTLAGGAGVSLGLAYFRGQGEKWLGMPKDALRDVFWIYLLVVPLFLLASLWEFGMR